MPSNKGSVRGASSPIPSLEIAADPSNSNGADFEKNCFQWTTHDGIIFAGAANVQKKLPGGLYEIIETNAGIMFMQVEMVKEDLVVFPDTNSEEILNEIDKFWKKKDLFRQYGLVHKRGIIMYGPPGCGKSCVIRLLLRDVIQRGGIAINFTNPHLFKRGIAMLRNIEKNTPIIVMMEDIESILRCYNESDVLNLLDGANQIDQVVFLATTNYPEELEQRVCDRPSRFDMVIQIQYPNPAARRVYLNHVIGGPENIEKFGIDLDRWVKDTKNFSLSHIKELFISVALMENSYSSTLKRLRSMRESSYSSKDDDPERGQVGFFGGASWDAPKECSGQQEKIMQRHMNFYKS